MQGTVVVQLIVSEEGRATGVTVISPVGFGLDERARAAVEKWEFAPGMKEGKPVKVLALIEVNFRSYGSGQGLALGLDETAERQRTLYNEAVQTLKRSDTSAKAIDSAVKSLEALSQKNFPPAMHLVGLWEIEGFHLWQNPDHGLALIQKAATKNYGPALYEIAIRKIEGRGLPKDVVKGLEEMQRASVLGSAQAQLYVGNRYETGTGVPRDLDRARRAFRLCAAQGVSECQYRLGRLLLDGPDRPERDYVQAVAWFQLAGEQGNSKARDIASAEAAKLTPAQTAWMTSLKGQLVHK
jgi:TonB family protein